MCDAHDLPDGDFCDCCVVPKVLATVCPSLTAGFYTEQEAMETQNVLSK